MSVARELGYTLSDLVQKITDTYISNVDKILDKKEKEILEIS